MAKCGKGWTARCAAAKGKKCTCRCGGENHGATRREPDGKTREDDLYYAWDEKRNRRFLPAASKIERIVFSRDKSDNERQRGNAIVEVIYSDRAGTWPVEHRYKRHSPDGFEFGYGGSGPAEAALNILSLFMPVKEATKDGLYQDFKADFVAGIDQEQGGTIDGSAVTDWIHAKWTAEGPMVLLPETAGAGA